jgi:hypothetical protein
MSSGGSRLTVAIVWLGCLCAAASPAAPAQALHLTGRGGDADWGETPVVVPIKADLSPGSYVLEGGSSGPAIPAVVFEDADRRWLAAVLPAVPARKTFSYDLKAQAQAGTTLRSGIRFRPSGPVLEVTIDDRPLTTYRVEPGSKPFFYPLIGPTGDSFTRA